MNGLNAMLERRVRGVRIVDLAGAACLVLIVFLVYASKIGAGAEASRISETTRRIATEEQQVQELRIERAFLTQPDRLRRLSSEYLRMKPIPADHETTPEALLQRRSPPPPAVGAPDPASATPFPASSVPGGPILATSGGRR
jgi:cell division protein FtsL